MSALISNKDRSLTQHSVQRRSKLNRLSWDNYQHGQFYRPIRNNNVLKTLEAKPIAEKPYQNKRKLSDIQEETPVQERARLELEKDTVIIAKREVVADHPGDLSHHQYRVPVVGSDLLTCNSAGMERRGLKRSRNSDDEEQDGSKPSKRARLELPLHHMKVMGGRSVSFSRLRKYNHPSRQRSSTLRQRHKGAVKSTVTHTLVHQRRTGPSSELNIQPEVMEI